MAKHNPVVMVPIDQLRPDKSNPRTADPARTHLLRLSLSKLGFILPLQATMDGLVLSGHQRLSEAKSLGYTHVPVQYDEVRQKDIAGINILFNRRLAIDEPVATPSGWVPIGEIAEGDKVIGRDGKAHRVTGVSDIQRRRMYLVEFDDGTVIQADAEHLWTVEYTGKSQTAYIGTKTLSTEGVMTMLYDENRRISTPLIDKVELPHKEVPVDPWLLGVLLGDGSLSNFGVRLHTSNPDFVFPKAVAALPEGVEAHEVKRKKPASASSMDFVGGGRGGVHNNPLLYAFRELGLSGTTAANKFVPEQYLWASSEQRLSLLRGLMDSDGCAGVNGVTPIYTTTSKNLAESVVHLVLSLGGKARIRVMREATGKWSRAYQVSVRLPGAITPFTRPDRAESFVGGNPRLRRRIVSVTEGKVRPSVCIAIDSEDHLYLTRNFIPSHNTTNDFGALDTGSKAKEKLTLSNLIDEANSLPDVNPADPPYALRAEYRDISDIGAGQVDEYDKKSVKAVETLLHKGIDIPVVITDQGEVVNGINRLFAAKENDISYYPLITIPHSLGMFASHFLNYLSMDYSVDSEFADLLRYSAYRRPQNSRGSVPKAMRFWANGEKTLLDRDSYTRDYWLTFRELHGDTIVDFGAGLCKTADFFLKKGIECIDFEPYRINPDKGNGVPDPAYSRKMALEFLKSISQFKAIDSIFLASVLNSIPFPRDRMCVLAINHALCSLHTVVYGTCRDWSDFVYEYGGIRQATYFTFDSEPGVRLGDALNNPKLQRFYTQEETASILKTFWVEATTWPG